MLDFLMSVIEGLASILLEGVKNGKIQDWNLDKGKKAHLSSTLAMQFLEAVLEVIFLMICHL